MLKKKFIIFILIFCMVCPIIVGCASNNDNGNNNQDNNITNSINISYMKDLSIDLGSSTAFGIKKGSVTNASPRSARRSKSLLNASLMSNEPEITEKNYLYTTTETYENGNVEYDNNSITKVTFRKNTEIQEDIYDSEGNLIESNQTITQAEIPAQINKLYVNEKYMFMQFVALVDESGNYNYIENNETKSEYVDLRPEELIYDENGISDFDLKNYYSSALSQSFVVDLANGNIYKISNFNISKIHDVDIVKDKFGNYYKMFINSQRELVFTDVMPNKDVKINGVRTDKYGYTFVLNSNSIDETDIDNKIIYTSNNFHMISNDFVMYTLKINDNVQDLDKQYVNGYLSDIDTNSKIYGLETLSENFYSQLPRFFYKGFNLHGFYPANNFTDMNGNIKLNFSSSNMQKYPNWFVGNSIYIYFIYDNHIYYKNIVLENYFTNKTTLNIDNFNLVSDKSLYYTSDYYMNVGKDKIKVNNVFYETTINGTNYYHLVEGDNNLELILLQNKEYTQNTYIFQPINK